MPFAVSLSQLALALVFAIAGTAKLADPAGTRQAMEGFGLPAARAGALMLPILELGIAAALLPAPTAGWAAFAAVVLLLSFEILIFRALRAGSAPDCNCFGGLTQTEIGRGTLVRNVLLATGAAVIAVSALSERLSAFDWISVPASRDRIPMAGLIVLIAGLAFFCWQLLRQNGRLLLRLDAAGLGADATPGAVVLPPLMRGAPAPAFAGTDLEGNPVSLESLLALGLPVALLFTSPGCAACELVLDAVGEAQRERGDALTVAVISGGSIDRIAEKAANYGLERVVPQHDDALFDAYRVNGFPGIVKIDSEGTIVSPVALGPAAVREVLLSSSPAKSTELATG